MATEQDNRKFKYPEEDTYAPIDWLAVLALICGFSSAAAVIFSPIFIILGILGVIFGLSSLLRIGRSEGTLSGKWVAIIGVGFALLYSSTYLAYMSSRDAEICGRARNYAEEWINMIRTGKHLEAHQLTKSFFQREYPGTDLKKYYDPKASLIPENIGQAASGSIDLAGTPYDQMTDFYAHPVMKILKEEGENCDVRFVQVLDRWRKGKFIDYVVLEYEVVHEKDGKPEKELFAITMLREIYPKKYGAHWAIDMIDQKKTLIDRERAQNKS